METVKVYARSDGSYQADVVLTDGRDFHAIGRTPGEALIELGLYWAAQGHMSDNERLARVLAGSPPGRLAHDEPNFQSVPIRTPEGRAIREAFLREIAGANAQNAHQTQPDKKED